MQRLLAIRGGQTEDVIEELTHEAARAVATASDVEAFVLKAEEDDPVAALIHHMRPSEAVLELRSDSPGAAPSLAPMLGGLSKRLGDGIHADLSGAVVVVVVVVEENRVVPSPEGQKRYMALMRRKAGTTHEEYVDYHANKHVQLGRRCPGTTGYHQNYVDGLLSKRAADACVFGVWDLDSVTELFFPSVEEFYQATTASTIHEESAIDEAYFVDGPTMSGFCASIVSRFQG